MGYEMTQTQHSPRDFAAELEAARIAGDWDAHARIWEERRVAAVEADEGIFDDADES